MWGQVAFSDMQVGPAYRANLNANQYLTRGWFWLKKINGCQGMTLDWSRMFDYHCFHEFAFLRPFLFRRACSCEVAFSQV
jgi:hypothetical protein